MRVWFASLLALAFVLPARADEPAARDLLARMGDAMRSLDYVGSMTYEHAGRTDTLRVFHAGGARERERLVSLNGPRSELVRDGRVVTCLRPDGSTMVFTNGPGRRLVPLVPEAQSRALDEHYAVSALGEDRVAGYPARIVEILPRDALRYGYRLWLENGTQMLLRSAVIDREHRVLEQFMFVSVDIGSTPSETDLLPSQRDAKAVTPPDERPLVGTPSWQVGALPPGFALTSARRPAQGDAPGEHLVYSDGLASVSVYLEPHSGEPLDDVALNRGIMNVYTRIDGAWRVTALGDVPAQTVAAIARSVARLPTAAE